jgi:hypothetical protein
MWSSAEVGTAKWVAVLEAVGLRDRRRPPTPA